MSSAGVPPATMVPASALYGPELTELAKERLRGLSVVVKTDRPGKVKTYLFFNGICILSHDFAWGIRIRSIKLCTNIFKWKI